MRFSFFSTLAAVALLAQEMVHAVNLSTQGTRVEEEQFYDSFAELETQEMMSQADVDDQLSQTYLEEEDSKAQVSSDNYADFLTQINAEIETEAKAREQLKEESLAVFSDYLAQIGVTEVHSVLAQLTSELGSDHVQSHAATEPQQNDQILAQGFGIAEILQQAREKAAQQSQNSGSSEDDSSIGSAVSSGMSSIPDTDSYRVDETDDIDSLDLLSQLSSDEDSDDGQDLAQVGSEDEGDLDYLGGFLAQISAEDLNDVMAQLASNYGDNGGLEMFAGDPMVKEGLAQVANEEQLAQIVSTEALF